MNQRSPATPRVRTGWPGEIASPRSATRSRAIPSTGRGQRRLGELSLEVGDRRLREGDLALRDGELLLGRSSLGLVQRRIGENETGLRFAQRGRVFVILLPARIVLRRQHRDSRELLLGQRDVGVGDRDVLRRRVAFFLAHARYDVGEIGARRFRVRLRFLERGRDLRARQRRERLALARLLSRFHRDGSEPGRNFGRDADLRLVHDADERRRRFALRLEPKCGGPRRSDEKHRRQDRDRPASSVHGRASLREAKRVASTASSP